MLIEAPTRPASLLRASDLTHERLGQLLELAEVMKARGDGPWRDLLARRTVALVFEKPSTRTRVSLAAAVTRLGGEPLVLSAGDLQLGRGETIEDTARVLSRYCSAITVRTFAQEGLERLAGSATVPVVNALSDEHHPLQALADLLTIRERFGALRQVRVAFVGDGRTNVCHSLLEAGALAGMRISVAAPAGYEPDAEILRGARDVASRYGGSVSVTDDPREAVRLAQVVATDVHVSMGEEAERRSRLEALSSSRVTAGLMAAADEEAIFLHCLPAHRGEEVDAEVIDGPQSVVFDQAENRMHTAQALLYALVTGNWASRWGRTR